MSELLHLSQSVLRLSACPSARPSAGPPAGRLVLLRLPPGIFSSKALLTCRRPSPGPASHWHLILPSRHSPLPPHASTPNSWTRSDSRPPHFPSTPGARERARHVTAAGLGVRAQRSAGPPSEAVVSTCRRLEQTSAHKTSPHIWPPAGSAKREPPASLGSLCCLIILPPPLFAAALIWFCWPCFSASPPLARDR